MFIVVCGRAGATNVGACVACFPTMEDARADARSRCETTGDEYTVAEAKAVVRPKGRPVPTEVSWEKL